MILAIDGTSLVYTFYHACKDKDTDTFEAVLGRIHRLKETMQFRFRKEPFQCIVAFDQDGPTYRHLLVTGYKAGRPENPEIDVLHANVQEAIGYSQSIMGVVSPPGYEADDVLATIAAKATDRVIIHSSDKDMNQCLVQGRVTIAKKSWYDMDKQHLTLKYFSAADLSKEFGFGPSRWIDYQCLVGDTSDGVAGAYGIGPKTAMKVLAEHTGPLEDANVYRLPLKSSQRSHWWDFLDRLPALREVFRLQTRLKMPAMQAELVGEY